MSEATEQPTTPTEGSTSKEAINGTLLTSTEPAVTTDQQQQSEPPKEGTQAAEATTTEEAKPEGAPEKYEFRAPEGKEYDAVVLEPFAEAAKAANLTQEAAQKLLDKMAPAVAARQQEQVKNVLDGWLEASRSDREFGGDKLKENLGIAKKAMDTYASPELRTLLNTTGLGNNPEIIRMFYKVGKSIGGDGFVTGKPAQGGEPDWNKVMYDKSSQ